ncbi:GMC oxidoreductase [Xylariaceae sp. FL0255]|nr:GMC oxidoreductase [Xylariaceae sp. FL0255]
MLEGLVQHVLETATTAFEPSDKNMHPSVRISSIVCAATLGLATQVSCDTTTSSDYDYIIAGAGTAGLVLANRLSEDPSIRVAVIDPGQDVRNNINVTDPSRFGDALGTSIDWYYQSTPQPRAGNRSLALSAGKAIGGTSTINGMTYIRGDKAEFDAWEELGNEGWNWDALLPYYEKAEKFTVPSSAQAAAGATYEADFHGETGHVHTGYPYSLINGSFHTLATKAAEALGYPLVKDVNAGSVRGFDIQPQTLDRDLNRRSDAAFSYYYGIEDRPNLTLINGTVKRIAWVSSTSGGDLVAEGLEYTTPDGKLVTVCAGKEVILSAGALRSPLILEGSGIGNPNILEKLNIPIKIALPTVGEHLQDQPNAAIAYTPSSSINLTGSAPYATFATAADLFGASNISALAASTRSQLSTWAKQVVAAAGNSALELSNVEKLFEIQHDLIFEKNVTIGEAIQVIAPGLFYSAYWLLLPFSWGSVHLTTTDGGSAVKQPMVVDPRYMLVDFDLDVQVALGRFISAFWNTEPISALNAGRLAVAGRGEVPVLGSSDAEWVSFTSESTTSNYHSLGTASMMARELGGVVDPSLKVYGTSNVRVVDASVLPTQFSGHLTATIYAVAERAADIIKAAS